MFGRSCVDQQESAGSQRFKVMTAERVASHWQNVCINFNLLLYWSVNMWSFWAIPSLLANCQKRTDEEEKYLTWGFQSFFLNSRSAPIHTETLSQICVLGFICCSCRNLNLHRKISYKSPDKEHSIWWWCRWHSWMSFWIMDRVGWQPRIAQGT